MANVGVILASHGKFADGSLDTVKFIMGEVDFVETICILPSSSVEDIKDLMTIKCEKLLEKTNHVIVMTDILCGTPSNVATQLFLTQNNISIIAGYNIPILLELLTMRANDSVCVEDMLNHIKEVYSSSFRVFVKNKEVA